MIVSPSSTTIASRGQRVAHLAHEAVGLDRDRVVGERLRRAASFFAARLAQLREPARAGASAAPAAERAARAPPRRRRRRPRSPSSTSRAREVLLGLDVDLRDAHARREAAAEAEDPVEAAADHHDHVRARERLRARGVHEVRVVVGHDAARHRRGDVREAEVDEARERGPGVRPRGALADQHERALGARRAAPRCARSRRGRGTARVISGARRAASPAPRATLLRRPAGPGSRGTRRPAARPAAFPSARCTHSRDALGASRPGPSTCRPARRRRAGRPPGRRRARASPPKAEPPSTTSGIALSVAT